MGKRAQRNKERALYDPYDPTCQHPVKTAGEIVNGYINNKLSQGISNTNKAYVMWCKAAGKRAASHTMAVWVNEKKNPVELVVYLDNSSLIVDYTTNAELYIDRLTYIGFPVSGLKFRLSNKVKTSQKGSTNPQEEYLPPLTDKEKLDIKNQCATLPERIRKNASNAMEMSIRRQKLQTTGNSKTDA